MYVFYILFIQDKSLYLYIASWCWSHQYLILHRVTTCYQQLRKNMSLLYKALAELNQIRQSHLVIQKFLLQLTKDKERSLEARQLETKPGKP